MKLLVFGGTGGTGRAIVQQALEQGHIVTIFARNPSKVRATHENLKVVKGDILDCASVEAAVKSHETVVSALGARPPVPVVIVLIILCQIIARILKLSGNFSLLLRIAVPILLLLIILGRNSILSRGTRNIVAAMQKFGVKRFICESSLGVGDSKGQLGLLYTYILIPILLRGLFADKEVQEKIIKDSALDWVIVRPAALTNEPKTGHYDHGESIGDRVRTRKISRADVAEFMLKQLTSNEYLHKTPGLVAS
jgi:putative NADH-flavin reductase